MREHLPIGWIEERLADVIEPRGEKVSPSDFPECKFIGMDHVESQTTRIIGFVPASGMKSNASRFYTGDVLYGRLRPYLNKVTQPEFCGLASAEFIVFPDTPLIKSDFLKYRLNAADFVSFASHLNEGDRPRVNFDQIGDFRLLIPPPNEQKRIVAKIEELFSELDKGIESLKTAREQLKVYRQAVLKHAFEGNLTADWRERNSENSCPNQEIIRSETPTKLPLLPKSWCWQRFAEIANVASNLVDPRLYPDSPHIAPDNIERGSGRLLNYRSISEDKVFSPKHKFSRGQILYSKIRPYLSKLIIAPFEGLCSADMYPIDTKLNTRYMYFFMMTSFFVNKASTSGSRTILPKINQKELSQIPFPVCSKEEQEVIVSRIELLLSLINRFEDDITSQLSQAEAVRQSILKKAFSGKLVAQDPNDEPASVLLERIRAEKEAQSGKQKTKQKHSDTVLELAGIQTDVVQTSLF